MEKGSCKRFDFIQKFPYRGGAGCLYPPNSLHEDVFKEKLFMSLCPSSDDVWFWAMALLKGTKICSPVKKFGLKYIDGTQENGLWININSKGENDCALARVFSEYPIVLTRLTIGIFTHQ